MAILISWWIFPFISSLMWLSMLLGLLLEWVTNGEAHLPSMEPSQTIAYISDTGAFNLKPLFIAGSFVTVIFLDIGFFAERWLRHTGRLAKNTSRTQKALSVLSLLFALVGAAGLCLLSIMDTYRHSRIHNLGLGLFIIGYVISAIFLCAEYQRLGIHYRNHKVLAASFWVKLAFIVIEVALAIAFIVHSSVTHDWNTAAILEWAVSFVFTFYIMSFVIDLLPSVRTKSHIPQGHKDMIMAESGMPLGDRQRFSQSSTTYESNLVNDSAGPNQPGAKYEVPAGAPAPRRGLPRLFSNLA
ncbi:hypothetical protein LTR05_006541 [Lithohypha guttulata]|uniref:CWH43-like N-terminal domain-containing protein n=1 Tax=Lithohypha guttulata TaxID=1690604 RepID=A0AAN7SWH3_9EURO|nr:hypothetical protein LTR05_006541 [Lithohypha guttulata]